jgi:hypothetical protein
MKAIRLRQSAAQLIHDDRLDDAEPERAHEVVEEETGRRTWRARNTCASA